MSTNGNAPPVPVPPHKIEFFLSGAWTSVSVFNSSPIHLTSGRSPESSAATTSSLSFDLPNTDGRYSSKNPLGIYYGQFKRGVPARFSVDTGIMRMVSPISAGSVDTTHRATTPDTAALDIAGDLDLRVERSGRFDNGIMIAKTNAYYLRATPQGVPFFQWYDNTAAIFLATATDSVPTHERYAVRAVLDVDNGAGGSTVTFYTSPTIGGTWTQLGAPVVTAGVTNIRNSLEGGVIGGGTDSYTYKGEIRNGIAGTVVANPDFTVQAEGTTSFVDGAGLTWTVNGRSTISRWSTRFSGYVAELEPTWDLSQNVATMTVTASGVLRRLVQSSRVDQSSYYKAMAGRNPIAYWPMEDASGAASLAAVTNLTPTMSYGSGATLASSSAFPSSQPLPVGNGAFFTAAVQPGYANPNTEIQYRFLSQIAAGTALGSVIARIRTDGTLNRFDVIIDTSTATSMSIIAYSNEAPVAQIGPFNMAAYIGVPVRWSVELKQNGTGVNFNLVALKPGDTSGVSFGLVTVASQTLGRATAVGVNGFTTSIVGHMSVENAISSIYDIAAVLLAYNAEQAAPRVIRLAAAAGVDAEQIGASGGSAMGVEPISDLVSKLQQCADADDGILFEARAFPGLYYREREDVYSQPPSLRLAYSLLTNQSVPAEDDQLIVNDQTVSRDGGSSARYQLTTGPLSVQDSPNGIGRYAQSDTLNLNNDGQLIAHAAWRVHLGTADDVRFPSISLDMHSPRVSGSLVSVLDLQIGDWMAISGPPLWFPPYEVQQQIFQVVETMTAETYNVTFSGRPARPQRVGVYDNPLARMDSSRSVLHSVMTIGGVVATVDGQGDAWITTASNPTMFPFNIQISGEIMTVTACQLSGGFYLMTVTRSVNGVLKAHVVSDPVSLAEPSYWGI